MTKLPQELLDRDYTTDEIKMVNALISVFALEIDPHEINAPCYLLDAFQIDAVMNLIGAACIFLDARDAKGNDEDVDVDYTTILNDATQELNDSVDDIMNVLDNEEFRAASSAALDYIYPEENDEPGTEVTLVDGDDREPTQAVAPTL